MEVAMLNFWSLLACSAADVQSFEYSARDRQSSDNAAQSNGGNTDQDTGFADSEDDAENRNDNASDVEDSNNDNSNNNDNDEGTAGISENELCGSRVVSANIGDCAENFSLPDQTQTLVSLHEFAGDVIFIDLSSFT